ncbi:hypothetical protein HHO41_03500 [Bacillus sp. DNRA2]|uniref:hypothetical protein n=1 Tax=Bacillus sp. DNRA2 TaxID=2723053 RepID=UPI00145DCA4E|nr:hypothetical protein [Bacillus sp. DNRA2]NMD69340.1 hypothetical protein [Bacillus sp. DNRA2]
MPAISKIRLTNVVYEEGNKRYNDEIFLFDGHNGAVLIENGGGKTVFIQAAIQAILPHADLADRKIKHTLVLENAPAHIAIEWIANDVPRRYVVTAVSLFTTKQGLDSLRYVYEYDANDANGIEGIPFVREGKDGKRTADRGEMQDYYSHMRDKTFSARTFNTIKDYKYYLEEQYHIIADEWESIAKINSSEGGVEAFFDDCKSTNQLFDRLLIPVVENSIVGHDAEIFADMFETQHASLKNYKKLKETIQENKRIEQQLTQYVSTYEHFHQLQLDYEKIKQKAKGTWNEIIKEIQTFTADRTDILEKLEEWKTSSTNYKVKSASFEIFREETEYKKLETDYKEALARKVDHEERLQQNNQDYYSLKLAELKRDMKEQEDLLKQIEAELAKFDQTEEVEDFQTKLDETKQALLGWFLTKMEELEKDKQKLEFQLKPILNHIHEAEENTKRLETNETSLRMILSKNTTIIEARTGDLKKLEQQLLANPEQEQVKEEYGKWVTREQFLDEEIIHLGSQIKQQIQEFEVTENSLEQLKRTQSDTNEKKSRLSFELAAIKNGQTRLIKQLALLRPQWVTLENVYLSQDTIQKRLIETIEKYKNDRNTLLYKERVAHRFCDDYENQSDFFGDSFLNEQLSSWKSQFDYLVTGVEYMQAMDEAEREKRSGYPLWPITLVTTNRSKPKVIAKLKAVTEQLLFPITVLTTEEALTIHERESIENWISPNHWQQNIDPDTFKQWKKQIADFAKEATLLREQKEQEIKRWEDGLNRFNQFLYEYPYEKSTSLNEELTKLNNLLNDLLGKIQQEKSCLAELQGKIKANRDTITLYRDELNGLGRKIEKAIEYFQFEKEIEEARKKEKVANIELEQVLKKLQGLKVQIAGFTDERDHLQERISNLTAELRLFNENEEYITLQTYSPKYTNESKSIINERMRTLEMKIRAITVAQGEWIAKKDGAVASIDSLKSRMEELRTEHADVDEMKEFPSDGKQLLQILLSQITNLKDKVDQLYKETERKKSKQDKQEGKWKSKIEQFNQDFPSKGILTFEQSLDEIAVELNSENQSLVDRKTYIDRELNRIEKEIKDISDARNGLDRFDESHHFNAPDIEAIPLSSDEVRNFTYNRLPFVQLITTQLNEHKLQVSEEQKEIERAKRRFREFCLNKITNIKLQQMAINGVEMKQNYADIIDFKRNMLKSIENSTLYANEHIRKSDEEMQLFINQIHSHLLTLVEELKQIPKKTKVKVLDDWKQIFSFSIPEWEEAVGKMRIRDYIEWILGQLESERFLNDQGTQDNGKVRKEIEMWLQSKQLLQIVMNNEVMKVSCRKVTNDNKVTTRSYSWEQSNVWSGGEKWSKNMTLFLGILNYVAEKKKHIQSNAKHHRAVILDNPFGKASSEHVLSPVFFVAEQLGFQIIALTAHTEGKFLQDYFPIIYSCRLRASADSSKKVMTKEKWLHYAYFQDHEPKTIERLGETEQLGLF